MAGIRERRDAVDQELRVLRRELGDTARRWAPYLEQYDLLVRLNAPIGEFQFEIPKNAHLRYKQLLNMIKVPFVPIATIASDIRRVVLHVAGLQGAPDPKERAWGILAYLPSQLLDRSTAASYFAWEQMPDDEARLLAAAYVALVGRGQGLHERTESTATAGEDVLAEKAKSVYSLLETALVDTGPDGDGGYFSLKDAVAMMASAWQYMFAATSLSDFRKKEFTETDPVESVGAAVDELLQSEARGRSDPARFEAALMTAQRHADALGIPLNEYLTQAAAERERSRAPGGWTLPSTRLLRRSPEMQTIERHESVPMPAPQPVRRPPPRREEVLHDIVGVGPGVVSGVRRPPRLSAVEEAREAREERIWGATLDKLSTRLEGEYLDRTLPAESPSMKPNAADDTYDSIVDETSGWSPEVFDSGPIATVIGLLDSGYSPAATERELQTRYSMSHADARVLLSGALAVKGISPAEAMPNRRRRS